jgi:Ser/Thr protein kinase RdoA (MazF antagonist)
MSLVCWERQREVKGFREDGRKLAALVAEQALSLYHLPRNASLHLVSLSENATYEVEAPSGRRWAMRVQRKGYQSKNTLASEIAWLLALRNQGVVATPVPVAGLDGEFVQVASHPSLPESRNVVLFAWENGREPDAGSDLRQCFRGLGAVTARMHAHSRTWARPDGFERFTWNFETALGETPRWGRWRDGLGMDLSKRDLFARTAELIRQRLELFGSGEDRFGLTHCDLRLANLLLHGGQVKVLDFDDCGFSWYMYDAATPMSFYEHLLDVPGLTELWLEGYRTVKAVTRVEEEEIPTFVMLRRLLLVAWVGSHAETCLARSLGITFTEQTVDLSSAYLKRFG